MKRWWILGWLLGLAVAGWSETLALTVHNDNGDPNEERWVWTEQFFVDDQGRLVRNKRVTPGPFVGDPETVTETTYTWAPGRVTWETKGGEWGPVEVELVDGQMIWSGGSTFRWLPGPGVAWEDGFFRYSWSKEAGFDQSVMEGIDTADRVVHEYHTLGARLQETVNRRPSDFLLLDRSPRRLQGTFYGNFLEENGWVPTGEIVLSGPGLWHPDPLVRLAHAVFLNRLFDVPVWPPFVFEQKFLR